MYKLKKVYLFFDAYNLTCPKLFLSNSVTHDTLIMEGETRKAFLSIMTNDKDAQEYFEVFKEYDFFDEL